jgi:hypothetical protein
MYQYRMANRSDRDFASMSPAEQTVHYIQTGESDILFFAWPGHNVIAKGQAANKALRAALIAEVCSRVSAVTVPSDLIGLDVENFARQKLEPLVRGLFATAEQDTVLSMFEKAIVFLTPDAITAVLNREPWLSTAWDLANLFLGSVDAPLLADEAPNILGLATDSMVYASMQYFNSSNPYEDVIVHEAAHLLHKCRRDVVGLQATRQRKYLLDIFFRQQETFAYCCEAYGRLRELGVTAQERQQRLDELEDRPPPDASVDPDEYVDILREALRARNGWKCILQRCAPPKLTSQSR